MAPKAEKIKREYIKIERFGFGFGFDFDQDFGFGSAYKNLPDNSQKSHLSYNLFYFDTF